MGARGFARAAYEALDVRTEGVRVDADGRDRVVREVPVRVVPPGARADGVVFVDEARAGAAGLLALWVGGVAVVGATAVAWTVGGLETGGPTAVLGALLFRFVRDLVLGRY